MKTYDQFIATKIRKQQQRGFDPVLPLNEYLFDWQRMIVTWAIKQGRCALFEDCGLGKTLQSLEWARHVVNSGGPVLGLCPLAVGKQTADEGEKFGIEVTLCRELSDFNPNGINFTNYDRLDLFREIVPSLAGVILDESSILKSFQGKTRSELTETFKDTPYRLCATATPSPNDITELGNHAEFLGICTYVEMLSNWFINDTANTGTWRLKKHATESFWRWVASWAICISKPSDIGFSDDGYELPPLNIHPVWIEVNEVGTGDELINIPGMSATDIHHEMRASCDVRSKAAAEIIEKNPDASWSIWCNTDYEADELQKAIPDATEVRGGDTLEFKEQSALQFKRGAIKRLISKGKIFGFGLNFQHCHDLIYFPDFSFEKFYQIVRRFYRFGQKSPVNCYLVMPRTANNIYRTLSEKMKQHQVMKDAIKYSAESLAECKPITIMNDQIKTESRENWTLHNGDCVRISKTIADEAIDFSVFSPPFADLFVYSADVQDMGNCASMADFVEQFGFLVKELYRITKPGRLCAVHCCDLMSAKWKDGEIELKNFSGEIIDAFRKEDWLFHTRITIWKDPVVEMQRTKALGLLHKQLLKDSCMSRVGSPEYVCVFRKPGVNDNPVSHQREKYPVEQWQKDASPVWMDINQGRVLNGDLGRERSDERHICPLQLDVIERLLRFWTNISDTVFSPFAGIGSEGYCAVKQYRKFIGCELKPSYFSLALSNLKRAEDESATLFNLPVRKLPPPKRKI